MIQAHSSQNQHDKFGEVFLTWENFYEIKENFFKLKEENIRIFTKFLKKWIIQKQVNKSPLNILNYPKMVGSKILKIVRRFLPASNINGLKKWKGDPCLKLESHINYKSDFFHLYDFTIFYLMVNDLVTCVCTNFLILRKLFVWTLIGCKKLWKRFNQIDLS